MSGETARLRRGMRVGPYEIEQLVGAGGMGEVYRALDPRLGRRVAIKVLTSSRGEDPGRVDRLAREARTTSLLNHPNILAIHDVGEHEGMPYLVSELLEGETLRQRLLRGPLGIRRATAAALQVANGLAAAHARGIVHRDLKPENVFVTRDGGVKILDFGLAFLAPSADAKDLGGRSTVEARTHPGTVLGTHAYMSPEQVRGEPADARSDIFAFGAVLHEMLSGERAFRRETTADTLAAILREEPAPLPALDPAIPPSLERIVAHCLAKDPQQRFQSCKDLAFALEEASSPSGASAATPQRRRLPARVALGVAAVALATFLATWAATRARTDAPAPPRFDRITFRSGLISQARFTHDGQTVVYDAKYGGSARDIFAVRLDGQESQPLGLAGARLFGVSSRGELAIGSPRGTFSLLARVPLAGGVPREVAEDVFSADWSPDGQDLAIARWRSGPGDPTLRTSIEFPVGHLVFKASGDWIGTLRVHPDGRRIAIQYHGAEGMTVVVVDRDGEQRTISPHVHLEGLDWSPDAREVWAAVTDREETSVVAYALGGGERVLWSGPGFLSLQDVAQDGRVLLRQVMHRRGIRYAKTGEAERDLSWLDGSDVAGLSPDGKTMLFNETLTGGGSYYARSTDGSPPIRLGEGAGHSFAPDGRSVLGWSPSGGFEIVPVAAGAPRRLPLVLGKDVYTYEDVAWLPGDRILFRDAEWRLRMMSLGDGRTRLVTTDTSPPGPLAPSPDGREFVARRSDRRLFVYPIDGGEQRPVAGALEGDEPIRWALDGALYVSDGRDAWRVSRIDLATGARTPWREIGTADSRHEIDSVVMTPDASAYAYTYEHFDVTLFVVAGLR